MYLMLPMPAQFSAQAFARVRSSRSAGTLTVLSMLVVLWLSLAPTIMHGGDPAVCGLDTKFVMHDLDADGRLMLNGGAGQILMHP